MKNKAAGQRGLIRTILIIVVALLIVSYFGINLRSLVSSETTQDNFSYTASTTMMVWNNYLKGPVTYVWDQVFFNLIWKPAITNLQNTNGSPQITSTTTP